MDVAVVLAALVLGLALGWLIRTWLTPRTATQPLCPDDLLILWDIHSSFNVMQRCTGLGNADDTHAIVEELICGVAQHLHAFAQAVKSGGWVDKKALEEWLSSYMEVRRLAHGNTQPVECSIQAPADMAEVELAPVARALRDLFGHTVDNPASLALRIPRPAAEHSANPAGSSQFEVLLARVPSEFPILALTGTTHCYWSQGH